MPYRPTGNPPGRPRKEKAGRPRTYQNRELLIASFDAEEAELIREFCRERMIDVSKFLRRAALEWLHARGILQDQPEDKT